MNIRKFEKSAKCMIGNVRVSSNLAGNVCAFKGKTNAMIDGNNTAGKTINQLQKNTKKLLH